MNKKEINVLYNQKYEYILLSFDDGYIFQAINLMKSIINNSNKKICFINITNSLSNDNLKLVNIEKLSLIVYLFNNNFLNFPNGLKWPVTSMYRILSPFLIEENVDYLYYLDCDMLCINNIDDLFDLKPIELISMCYENSGNMTYHFNRINEELVYCNSGFIIFNVKRIKKELSIDCILKSINENINTYTYPDQDFLNFYFRNSLLILNPFVYNNQINELLGKYKLKFITKHTKIIHYSYGKPWDYKTQFAIINSYIKYSQYLPIIKRCKRCRRKRIILMPYIIIKKIIKKIHIS